MPQRAAKRARRDAKAQASLIKRTHADLVAQLNDQVSFLRASAQAYDSGNEREAKRIAQTVRVLLHDTDQSRALVVQLTDLAKLTCYDTAIPINNENLATTMGVVNLRMRTGDPPELTYGPPLDDMPREIGVRWTAFGPWWGHAVSRVPATNLSVSRKEYILTVSNKEGGAHVDPYFSPLYDALARDHALGWTLGRIRNGVDEKLGPPRNNPVLAAVRQIGHEVLRTLDYHLWRLIEGPRMDSHIKPTGQFDIVLAGMEFAPVD